MISHILIHKASREINSFIIIDLAQHIAKAAKGSLKVLYVMVHEPQMEPAAHKVFLKL